MNKRRKVSPEIEILRSDRQVKIVLDGEAGEASPVDTGVPQGSPAAPIIFVTYLSGIFDEVEQKVPGVSGLSFVDDIGWWADGEDEEKVAANLSGAAAAAIDWAANNGVAFDHGKTEAAIFHRKKSTPTATVMVGNNAVPFNKEATRWLGIWLDSQLTLKEHHATRLKDGRNALTRLRRLAGRLGLSPANCRKVMTACIQSVAMFGAELWWREKEPEARSDGLESCSGWSTNKHGRQQEHSGPPTRERSRWSLGSDRRPTSWKTDSGDSGYVCSACHVGTKLERWSALAQRSVRGCRPPSHAPGGQKRRFC